MSRPILPRRKARRRALGLRLAGSLLAAAVGVLLIPDAPRAATPVFPDTLDGIGAARSALPGTVIDVRAGEFFFQAPDTIRSGLTTFRLRQIGMAAKRLKAGVHGRALFAHEGDDTRGAHMLWVVRLEQGKTISDLFAAAQAGDRATGWAIQLGGPSVALPPRSSNVTHDLGPGNYALVCYVGSAREDRSRSHLLRGMFRALTVLPAANPGARMPRPDITARIIEGGTVQLSAPIRAGTRLLRVENTTSQNFEFKFQRVPAGITGRAFLAQQRGEGPGIPWGGLGNVPAGRSVLTTIDFPPGEYVMGTWPPIRHPTSVAFTVAAGKR